MNYTAENHLDGKRRAREEIQQRFGLTWGSDQPMVAVVSRLTGQKGLDLIKHSIHHSLKRGAQFVLLGSAPDPKVQGDFQAMANAIGGPNAAFAFAFDEPLSHLVYAAADFVLVPSMFEPCGLTQMISMRYGAGKYFPPNTFRRLIAHTRLTLSFYHLSAGGARDGRFARHHLRRGYRKRPSRVGSGRQQRLARIW